MMLAHRSEPSVFDHPEKLGQRSRVSDQVVQLMGRLVVRSRRLLKYLEANGLIGQDERDAVLKDLLKVSNKIQDLNRRERIAGQNKLRETTKGSDARRLVESPNPDLVRTIPDAVLRRRLRSGAYDLLDFVDTMVEALKRLRYNDYIDDRDYVRYRRLVEILPRLRADVLRLMERYQAD